MRGEQADDQAKVGQDRNRGGKTQTQILSRKVLLRGRERTTITAERQPQRNRGVPIK
jgi:hypothetical protein